MFAALSLTVSQYLTFFFFWIRSVVVVLFYFIPAVQRDAGLPRPRGWALPVVGVCRPGPCTLGNEASQLSSGPRVLTSALCPPLIVISSPHPSIP